MNTTDIEQARAARRHIDHERDQFVQDLMSMVRRLAFNVNSTRLLPGDPDTHARAAALVAEANMLLRRRP